jgi:hypothetical protein
MKVTTQSTVNNESQTRKNLSPTKIAPLGRFAQTPVGRLTLTELQRKKFDIISLLQIYEGDA